MTGRRYTRRQATLGALAAAGGLVVAAALPHEAHAAGHMAGCGAPFGPLHEYLYATSPAPDWADRIIWRESNWQSDATNRWSGAAGLCQFLPSTWEWLVEVGMAYGSPYDPYAAMHAMNNCVRVGYYWMWSETDWSKAS